MIKTKEQKVDKLNKKIYKALTKLRQLKQDNPDLRIEVNNNVGSILNAYREGDIDFDEAVKILSNATLSGVVLLNMFSGYVERKSPDD